MLIVRNNAVVNRVRVVELTTTGITDQLLQPTSQTLQLDVVNGRRHDDDVVTERRHGVNVQLRRFQCLLSRLQRKPPAVTID